MFKCKRWRNFLSSRFPIVLVKFPKNKVQCDNSYRENNGHKNSTVEQELAAQRNKKKASHSKERSGQKRD